MYHLTPADFADTGQWRLVIQIRIDGLEAWLENTLHKEIPRQGLCDVKWERTDSGLLEKLESAVYDNPRLLDDFATRIILFDKKTIFVPSFILEESLNSEEEIYNKVYKGRVSDIFSEKEGEITALWTMAPGVKSFLLRTFPGARISSHLMQEVITLRKRNKGNQATLFIIQGINEADFILMKGQQLLSASSHTCETEDIPSMIDTICEGYGLQKSDITVVKENPTEE